jgi:hypothetical protein
MFPTTYKDKIPKSLSYPVKAKTISEAFADVPQAEYLKIWFSSNWALGLRKQGARCKIISVIYRYQKATQYTSHLTEELDWSSPKWEIHMEAIPIESIHHVSELLQKEVFPKLHKWFLSKTDITGTIATARFEVIYNEEYDKLEYNQDFKQL